MWSLFCGVGHCLLRDSVLPHLGLMLFQLGFREVPVYTLFDGGGGGGDSGCGGGGGGGGCGCGGSLASEWIPD